MTTELSKFGLPEMLRCSLGVRKAASGSPSMEAAAQRVCRYFYDELCADDELRACVLVRCYKTHPFGRLPSDLQEFAARALGASPHVEPPSTTMKCLTLLASAGDEPEWNDRRASAAHRAIPLPSPRIVERAPMIAQLIRDFGLDIAKLVEPSDDVVRDIAGRTYGVFHVEHALGSPFIPAQDTFVEPHGVRSVVGFGGSLPSGDLFAVILFSRVHVSADSADRFRTLALDVKSVFFPFWDSKVFEEAPQGEEARLA